MAYKRKLSTYAVGQRGQRLPGWEDISPALLAKDAGVEVKHVRESLTGRRNCTIETLRKLAGLLKISLPELVRRIDVAKELDKTRREQWEANKRKKQQEQAQQ